MSTLYKVWLEIEEIDESRDHYQTVDTPGGAVATFASYDAACHFVEHANHLLEDTDWHAQPQPLAQHALVLRLIHGRNHPAQNLDDWGCSAAPIRGVAWLHVTYFATLTVGFVTRDAMEFARQQTGWSVSDDCSLEIPRVDDLIEAAGRFYGDFELAFESS